MDVDLSSLASSVKKLTRSGYSFSPHRMVEWMSGINYENLNRAHSQIKSFVIEDQDEPITLVVTSHGGSSGLALSFYDLVLKVLCPGRLITIGSGDVDSSGIIVFLTGSERFITENTTLLLHMSGRTFDSSKRYSVTDMQAMVTEDKLKDEQYAAVVSERSGGKLSISSTLEMMENNTVLTAADAVSYGLAHHIL